VHQLHQYRFLSLFRSDALEKLMQNVKSGAGEIASTLAANKSALKNNLKNCVSLFK